MRILTALLAVLCVCSLATPALACPGDKECNGQSCSKDKASGKSHGKHKKTAATEKPAAEATGKVEEQPAK